MDKPRREWTIGDLVRDAVKRGAEVTGQEDPPASWVTNALHDAGLYNIMAHMRDERED